MDRIRRQIQDAFFVDLSALHADPFPSRTEIVQRIVEQRARAFDRTIFALLGMWVSEVEPSVVVRGESILGLAWAGDPQQRIVVSLLPDVRHALKAMFPEMPDVEFGHPTGNDF